ncbi:MAG: metallophosphoesterase family protein [Pirellulales bacterium]
MRVFDTVVVSDLHLGARNARTTEFLDFLETVQTDRLIVNGDLFQDPRLRGLRTDDVAVLDGLRKFARHADVVFLRGNHDPDASWYEGVLGLPLVDELPIHIGDRRYLIYHGHGWDRSLELPALVIAMADAFYAGSQWLDPSHRLAKALKRKCKTFCSAVKNLRIEAVRTAQSGFDGVILGHTHLQEDLYVDETHVLNSGCWTERPCGFIGIRDERVATYRWCSADHYTTPWSTPNPPPRVRNIGLPGEPSLTH